MGERYFEQREFVEGILSIVFSIIIVLLVLNNITINFSESDYMEKIRMLFSMPLELFSPEPTERMRYIVAIIMFPFNIYIFNYIFNKVLDRFANRSIKRLYFGIITVLMLSIFYLYQRDFIGNNFFYLSNNYFYNNFTRSIFLFGVVLLLVFFSAKDNGSKVKDILHGMFDLCSIILVLFVSFMNIYSIYSVNDEGMFIDHFNAVFYSVVQVFLGKALLVDLINQYGLYPHFLEPIFKMLGLSVFKFTVIMAVLLSISFICLFKFLKDVVKNRVIAFLGFISLMFYSYIFIKIVSIDPVFQYHPIRFFFPSLMIYLCSLYFRNNNKMLYYLSFVLYSVAVLWNFDTGIVVFLSWMIVLCYLELFRTNLKITFKKMLFHVVTGITIFFVTVGLYCLFIFSRYGSLPDFGSFFEYQKYFYISGFGMLPMKLIHPWNAVVLVYIIGLLYAARSAIFRNYSPKAIMVLLLSVLGTGIFSYYQGRSHDFNLLHVSYPAILLLTIFVDDLFHKIAKANKTILSYPKIRLITMSLQTNFIIFSILLYFLASSVFSLFFNLQYLISPVLNRQYSTFNKQPTRVTQNADFIKQYSNKGEEVLILSYHSAFYYLESQTVSSLRIPGSSELFLKKDYNKIIEFLENGKNQKIFLDTNFLTNKYQFNISILRTLFLSNYKVISMSPDNSIMLFTKPLNNKMRNSVNYLLDDNENTLVHYKFDPETLSLILKSQGVVGLAGNSFNSLSLSDNFTIEAIVKPFDSQVAYAAIIGNHPGYDGYEGFVVQQDYQNKNVYRFSFSNGKKWFPGVTFKLQTNSWNYLVIVAEQNTFKIINNGQLVGLGTLNSPLKNSTMPLYIGNWIYKDRPFNGIIDEIRISNTILSEKDILLRLRAIQEQKNNIKN